MISDFVLSPEAPDVPDGKPVPDAFYGEHAAPVRLSSYRELARAAGLAVPKSKDITTGVAPTYPFLATLLPRLAIDAGPALEATRKLEWLSREGWLRYLVMTFKRPDRRSGRRGR
jgi:hypothetical protein